MIEIETLGRPVSVFDKQVQHVVIQIPLEKRSEDGIEKMQTVDFWHF